MLRPFSHRMLALLCVLSLVPSVVHSKPRKKTEDASADVNLTGLYLLPRQGIDSAAGLGMSAYYERRITPLMSFGLNIAAGDYFSTPSKTPVAFDLAGRLFPVRATSKGELYLQGGMGLLFPKNNGIDNVGKRIHGTAGVGYRKWMGGNRYLNLGIVYDAYSPRVRPTSSIGFKIGYGMRFGRLRTPGRYRKLTRQKAIDLGIIYPDGYLTPMAVERHYHVVFAKRDPKTGVVIREVAVGRPGTSPPAKPAPVVAAKPASVKPAPVVAKPVAAAAKPAPKPAAPAPVKPVVAAAKPAVVQPKPAAPAPVKPVVAAPKPAPAVAKPAAKPRGMFEMNFGSASKSAANKPKPASGGLVNIDLGGSKSVITAPKAGTAAPINYAWVSGDSLTALAEAFYGDQNLYPILVDANESKLVSPQNLKPGRALLIPRGVDDVTKAKAREKSNLPHYLPWKKAGK